MSEDTPTFEFKPFENPPEPLPDPPPEPVNVIHERMTEQIHEPDDPEEEEIYQEFEEDEPPKQSFLGSLIPLVGIATAVFLLMPRGDKAGEPKGNAPLADGPTYYGPQGKMEPIEDTQEPAHQEPNFNGLKIPQIRYDSSTKKTVALSDRIFVIGNKTNSFETLINQASVAKKGVSSNKTGLIDRHFNKYRRKGSGYLLLCNTEGRELADALNDEFKKIYDEEGWNYDRANSVTSSRQGSLSVLRLAKQKKMPAVICEFGYVDDRVNGDKIGDFLKSSEGQKRIAEATLAAIEKVKSLGAVVLSAGHHGSRGTSGATYKGYHETTYAFKTFEQMARLIALRDQSKDNLKNVDWGYTSDKEVADTPTKDEEEGYLWEGDNLPSEKLVFADARVKTANKDTGKKEPEWKPVTGAPGYMGTKSVSQPKTASGSNNTGWKPGDNIRAALAKKKSSSPTTQYRPRTRGRSS